MKCWNEVQRDAISYFEWFCKNKEYEVLSSEPDLSMFSINGTRIDRNDFIHICENEIKKIFSHEELVKNYKFYLLANVEVVDKNSRIEKHKKIWKRLQAEMQLGGFVKGPEVEINLGETLFYSSIAEFGFVDILVALKIIAQNPYKYTIISSARNDVLTESTIRDIFNAAFGKSDLKYPEIDYCNLSMYLCSKSDIVFRWGDSSEEAAVALIFKPESIKYFEFTK